MSPAVVDLPTLSGKEVEAAVKAGKFDRSCYLTPNTPSQPIVSLVHQCLGGITLDCATTAQNPVQARRVITAFEDAFKVDWEPYLETEKTLAEEGSVFLNPPFNCGWKFLQQLQRQHDRLGFSAIALVLSGQLHNRSLKSMRFDAVCHWEGRVAFVAQIDGTRYQVKGMSYDVLLLFWAGWATSPSRSRSAQLDRFAKVFGEHGRIHIPYNL